MPKIERQAWRKLIHCASFFGRTILLVRPIGHAKNGGAKLKCASDEETIGNITIVLYYLNKACSFHYQSISIEGFCNQTVVVSGQLPESFFKCLK